ncbi:MAG TPA: glycosyltransferase N-terminal domain-containing protein [Sphingobacteriaceae bacterium]|nr:glycosyltransferase N-terminal domain-containing protein [Sphingobacteriaceae bacterium]
MIFLYDLGIQLYILSIRIASLRNTKAKQWLNGQKNLREKISGKINPGQQYIWFHFASLGEFEQGRPVMEQIKKDYPDEKLFITFFSPSGYEIRKHNSLSGEAFYLPIDTRKNANALINLINPKIAVFTKYEYWYHYFKELNEHNIPLYLISASFIKEQSFFRWYGRLNREMLKFVTHFFVQNNASKLLLKELGFENSTITGDTRFDRVMQNALHPKTSDIIKDFCGEYKVFIGGSTWPDEEALIARLIPKYPDWKFILAPHEVSEEKITSLEKILPGKSIRYSKLLKSEAGSQKSEISGSPYSILIIDNIGMLSSLYQYADIAYIGGAFGAGLHNVLEAAALGIPVVFGPKYQRFPEAKDLIERGAGFSVKDFVGLDNIMSIFQDDSKRTEAGDASKRYVIENKGATTLIMSHIQTTL